MHKIFSFSVLWTKEKPQTYYTELDCLFFILLYVSSGEKPEQNKSKTNTQVIPFGD